jgi:hypothetical protein
MFEMRTMYASTGLEDSRSLSDQLFGLSTIKFLIFRTRLPSKIIVSLAMAMQLRVHGIKSLVDHEGRSKRSYPHMKPAKTAWKTVCIALHQITKSSFHIFVETGTAS